MHDYISIIRMKLLMLIMTVLSLITLMGIATCQCFNYIQLISERISEEDKVYKKSSCCRYSTHAQFNRKYRIAEYGSKFICYYSVCSVSGVLGVSLFLRGVLVTQESALYLVSV